MGELRVAFAGRLSAGDMGRLERVCSEALTTHPLRLQFDLGAVTEIDATAHALLKRFEQRGARVVGWPGERGSALNAPKSQGLNG